MKGDVAEAEVETLVFERQFSKPVDFDKVQLPQMREPLAAAANHLAGHVPLENFRYALQHNADIPLSRGPEGGLVLSIVTGDGLVGILLSPHVGRRNDLT